MFVPLQRNSEMKRMTANCSGFPPHSPEQGKGAHGEDNYPCDAGEVVSLFANVS